MRFVLTSDTHSLEHLIPSVPPGDVLIHAGDFLNHGLDIRELARFNQWLGALPHRHKIVIAGNHDFLFERSRDMAVATLTNATYLENSGVTIDGFRIWGSPVQPKFLNWAFNVERGEPIRRFWDMIPDDTDVLVTHGPPIGILDTVLPSREHLGCADLRDAVLRTKPQIHVFGHIHGGSGQAMHGVTHSVNAAFLSEAYRPAHMPWVVDLVAPKSSRREEA